MSAAEVIAATLAPFGAAKAGRIQAAAVLDALEAAGYAIVKRHRLAKGCGCVFTARFDNEADR
jgi:hypothetical protein